MLFAKGNIVRIWKLLASPFKQEFQDTIDRLKDHAKIADQTALAIELLRAQEFRAGKCLSVPRSTSSK